MQKEIDDILCKSADPQAARKQLERFEKAYLDEAGSAFDWSARGAPSLARIFGNTRALTGRLIAHPLWADGLAGSPYFATRKPRSVMEAELAQMIEGAAPSGDEDAFMRALRHFRHREMIRILMRDLGRSSEVKDILKEWSNCADIIIEAAWQRAHEVMTARHGKITYTTGDGCTFECTGTVIALGKLGGRELNLSSDVDLIIVYCSDEGGAHPEGGAHITNHEFYVKQTALFTRYVSQNTADGFAFRVDHELRPEGPQGPLANSLDAAERYYEYFGRDWERQALIRARPVAGDEKLGERFMEAIRPFVYRRSIAIKDLAHMREMKRKMERDALRRSDAYDLKLGTGGIREVEFLTQAICLLFGGGLKGIRLANTFEAIDALADAALIHPYGASRLKSAYSFLRRTENMLQAADDLQVHRLPSEKKGIRALARQLGYDDEDAAKAAERMMGELADHRIGVTRLFRALFEADYERSELVDAIRDNAARATNDEETIESLAWFKNQEVRRIRQKDLAGSMPLQRILKRLTLAAEAILAATLEMATRHLQEKHGLPRLEDGSLAGFAIVGMGSLGSGELDYGSDLDLCFLYADGGRTDGKQSITNIEYFTKLAQRVISTVSLPGRYGKAYSVDSELRPSGQAGTLVATLDSFRDYHTNKSQIWERFSLMKARAITGDDGFLKGVRTEIKRLAFELPSPPIEEIKAEITRIRDRTIEERVSVKPDVLNLKIGRGGLADIESMVQFEQLLHATHNPELERQNTFEIFDALKESGLIDPGIYEELAGNYTFLRRLLSRLRLAIQRATDEINVEAWYAESLAYQMGLATKGELALEIERRMAEVAGLFEREIG
jgi:glutamine synthetase adenylyltransferase